MAKIVIDQAAYTGGGLCASSRPELFEIQDDNKAHVKSQDCSGCDINQVAAECPNEAIKVE